MSTIKRKFVKFDCVKYVIIDIEKKPSVQYQRQFDIVLAINCIHVISNLLKSLNNISKLLQLHDFVSLIELTIRNF